MDTITIDEGQSFSGNAGARERESEREKEKGEKKVENGWEKLFLLLCGPDERCIKYQYCQWSMF